MLRILFVTFITCALLICAASAQNWEWLSPLPQGNNLSGICFADSMNVWAVGTHGLLMHSSDGGMTFSVRESEITSDLSNIQFLSPQIGWMVGSRTVANEQRSAIFHTQDGGESWTTQYDSTDSGIRQLEMLDDEHGHAIGPYMLLSTTDGGQSWVRRPETWYYGMCSSFPDPEFGVVSEMDSLYRTTDGGVTWRAQRWTNNLDSNPWGIVMMSRTHGCLLDFTKLYRTTDSGNTWVETYTEAAGMDFHLLAAKFVDTLNGWVWQDNDRLVRTTDGGVSWALEDSVPYAEADIDVFDIMPSGRAVACGSSGMIARRTSLQTPWQIVAGEPFVDLTEMGWVDHDHGWALGRTWQHGYSFRQPLMRTADRWATWTLLPDLGWPDSTVGQMAFPSLMEGWAIVRPQSDSTSNNFVTHTTDGGLTWNRVGALTDMRYSGVSFPNADTGYVTTAGNAVWRTFDAGSSWERIVPGSRHTFGMPYFVNGLVGWISSTIQFEWAVIVHTTDGGNTWRTESPGNYQGFADMGFFDSQRGWALMCQYLDRQGGVVLVTTTDSGINWQPIGSTTIGIPVDLSFQSPAVGFEIRNNQIWRTTDGGQLWTFDSEPTDNPLTAIYSNADGDNWITGRGATIMHRVAVIPPNAAREPQPTPIEFHLSIFPNPFNPVSTLRFDLAQSGHVHIVLYDLTGRALQTLIDEIVPAGEHNVALDGSGLASGVYFARIQGPSCVKTQKLVLLK